MKKLVVPVYEYLKSVGMSTAGALEISDATYYINDSDLIDDSLPPEEKAELILSHLVEQDVDLDDHDLAVCRKHLDDKTGILKAIVEIC